MIILFTSFNRNLLKTDPAETWLRLDKIPSGTANDPIIINTGDTLTRGEEWLNFLQSQNKTIIGMWVAIDGGPAEQITETN